MKIWKKCMLFSLGGTGYMGLELLWRGWSHGSMFVAGGSCFLLLGALGGSRWPLPCKTLAGAGVITGVELLAGLLVNSSYGVWDYRRMPLNFRGQICLPFALLWVPVGLGGMLLYSRLDRFLSRQTTELPAAGEPAPAWGLDPPWLPFGHKSAGR